MKSILKNTFFWISIILFIYTSEQALASHAQGTDITYQCLGNNQYQINLSFYRDCAGAAAPNTATVNVSSISCGQSFTVTLNRVAGTGVDVTPLCPSLTTQCNGGAYPGVQEYLYTGVVTLPTQCADWVFGFSLCCRNAAITTIANPSGENIYVESTLNNLNFPCNNSPSFLNKPVPFVCAGQPYCYNNGANEIDGDSLYYRLLPPKTSATTTVTYNAPYSASQPLASTPAVTFDNNRGDMCMSPSMLQITVFAVMVEEWRNGIMVGSVIRDIQLKTITCTNINPYVNGINNTGVYSMNACAGVPVNFTIPTFDADAGQNVTITWDNGIPSGTFVSSGGARPTATFSWTPTTAQISNNPYCFTVTVKDDNCPYFGNQVFSFCITVTGFAITTSATNANCGTANGTVAVQASPAGSYSYAWSPSGGNSATANAMAAGTYTVTVTSTVGCTHTATATVGNNGGALNVNLTPTNVLCFGNTTGAVAATASGAQSPYTYAWTNGPNTANYSGLGAGTYTVTVTSANGCSSTVSAVVSQPSAALSYTMSQSNVSCYGLTNGNINVVTAGGTAPYTYQWNTNPIQTTATAANLASGPYSVLITDANLCSATANTIITQPNLLTASNSIINHVSCFGLANGAAMSSASGGTTPYTYQWNTSPVQSTPTATGLAVGNYTVFVSDANSCSATASITITEPTAVSINTSNTPISCFGAANGQATVSANGGTPNYTYQWLPSGGTNATANGLSPTTYTVIVSDNNSCSKTATVNITQPTALSYTVSKTDVTCFGAANGNGNIVVTGGTTPYNYFWNTSPVQNTTSISNLSGGVYYVTVMDANSCTISASVTINEPSQLTATATVVKNVTCFGLANGIATTTTSGGTSPYTYQWNTNPAQTAATASGLAPGNYSILVTDANNCTSNSTITITQPNALSINVTRTNITCNGASNGTAIVTSNGGTPTYSYQWLPTGGTSANVIGLSPGTYTVNVSDANACSQSATILITEPAPIVVNATANTTICLGQSTTISASANGGNGNYLYTWTGNGVLTGASQNVNPNFTTTYTVNVTDISGCPGNTATTTVNVTSLSLANLSVSPGVRICEGTSTTIFSTISGNTGPVTVTWSHGLGNGNGPFTVTPLTTTNYMVSVTDACNNTVTATIPIIVNPLPVVNIFPLTAVACEQAPLTFSDNSTTNAGAQYLWSFGDGTTSTQTNPTHTYTASGIYNVNIIITSNDGCIDSSGTTATITVYPASIAKFESEALDGTELSPVYRFINTSSNVATFFWDYGDGTTSTSEKHPIHEYKQKGDYHVSLTTTSIDGCVSKAETKIAVIPEFVIYIPNAFTPDGDGTNDIFVPKGMEITEFTMEIYSRWGEMIFRTNDLNNGWNGRANFGVDIAQMGTYVYKIAVKDLKNKTHEYTGHVTLIKNSAKEY